MEDFKVTIFCKNSDYKTHSNDVFKTESLFAAQHIDSTQMFDVLYFFTYFFTYFLRISSDNTTMYNKLFLK